MNAADGRPVGSQVASGDRFAALQRKLVDLERVHNESKKSVCNVIPGFTCIANLNSSIRQTLED